MQTNVNIELLRENALFTLSRKKFSNSKKIRQAQIHTSANRADRVKGSKVLIVADELDAIHKALDELYSWIVARCVPSCFKDGLYLARAEMAEQFNAECERYKREILPPLIADFQAVYEYRKAKSREDLGPLYDEADYPLAQDLPSCFGVSYNWFTVTIPQNLSAEMQQEEARKLESKFQQAEAEIMAALREGFAEIIQHVTERLTVGDDGKAKTFRDTLFENLTQFIGTFSARNIIGDKELGAMVSRAQSILEQVRGADTATKAQVVRDSRFIRDEAAKAFNELKAAVDASVTTLPSRKFDLED
jgi:hypothetical protein